MAVNFLNNLDLNGNQLLNARLQVLASDPGSAAAGDIIYNSTSNVLKFFNGTTWVDPSAGSYTSWQLNTDSGSGTIVNASQVTLSGSGAINTVLSNPTGNIFGVGISIESATSTQKGAIELFSDTVQTTAANSVTTTASRTYGVQLNSSGQGVVNVPWSEGLTYTLPTSQPNANTGRITLTGSDGSTDTVNFVGSTNETEVTQPTSGVIAIGLPNNVTLTGDLTVGGGDITLSGTGRIQGIDTVTAGTDAANKTYVDNAIVGSLVFQGGYNAATNTPDLDSSPSSSIKKGWAYVVTVAGTFFTEAVEVGDFLFAQSDAPTTLADWTTVQNNIDIATLTNIGIGNVIPSALADQLGISVVYNGSGTASLGLDIDGLTESGGVGATAQADDLLVFQDVSTTPSKNFKITVANLSTAIGASGSFFSTGSGSATYFMTHNFGTRNVFVEAYENASPYQTVYGTVTRPNLNQAKIEFGAVTGPIVLMAKKL